MLRARLRVAGRFSSWLVDKEGLGRGRAGVAQVLTKLVGNAFSVVASLDFEIDRIRDSVKRRSGGDEVFYNEDVERSLIRIISVVGCVT